MLEIAGGVILGVIGLYALFFGGCLLFSLLAGIIGVLLRIPGGIVWLINRHRLIYRRERAQEAAYRSRVAAYHLSR